MIAGRILNEIERQAKQRSLADENDAYHVGILTAAGVRVYALVKVEIGHGYAVLRDVNAAESDGNVYMDLTKIIAVQPIWL